MTTDPCYCNDCCAPPRIVQSPFTKRRLAVQAEHRARRTTLVAEKELVVRRGDVRR